MSIQAIRKKLGDFAKDIKLNLGSVLSEEGAPGLTERQIYGIALASAYATQNRELIDAIDNAALYILSESEYDAAKLAATLMAMNNIYYRFVHLVSDKSFTNLSANLRMNGMANPGIDKKDFELYSLAVSAINGCGMCIDAHVKELKHADVSQIAIQSSIRIAATINATNQALLI